MEKVDFSVVIPVHNSEQSLAELSQRIDVVCKELDMSYEIVFVNDGSTDNSLSVLRSLREQNECIKIIDLFRNYGQQNALMCGFNQCVGDVIITMDDDLQHDPQDISILYKKLLEGFDVVIGVFVTKKHGLIKNFGSACIRALNKQIFKLKDKNLRFTSFRMIRREVIEQIKDETTNYPYISGLLVATTNRIANVNVSHNVRLFGKSSYKLSSLVSLSYNLIINYSSLPLKLIGYLGLGVSLFSMFFGSYFVIKKLLLGTIPAGITTIIVLISFYNALIFIFLFFLSEYVSRILKESSHKKQYVIREVIK